MTLFLRALLSAIQAGEAARLALGTTVAGAAADGLADARASLDEALELLQRRPATVRAALAWCEAVRRTDALLAACTDAEVNGTTAAHRDACAQHAVALNAERRALWALREEVGK